MMWMKLQSTAGFNTQPPEGGWRKPTHRAFRFGFVSTHSRLKAAGLVVLLMRFRVSGFNTQPPEGGWVM